jgi:tetratricopeptide (TPR) repeat protein
MIGDRPTAQKLIDRALQLAPNDSQILCSAGLIYNKFGDTDKAIFWLHKAVLAGYSVAQLRTAPAVENLQGDPRFKKLFQTPSEQIHEGHQ